MKTWMPVFLAAGLLVAASWATDDAKDEKAKLHGTWNLMTIEERGQSKQDNDNHRLIFAGDELTVKKGDEQFFKAKFKIDATKKPMEIDIEIIESLKEEMKGKTGLGIYSVDGDMLKLCVNEPGVSDRPKEFLAQADTKCILLTLQKQK